MSDNPENENNISRNEDNWQGGDDQFPQDQNGEKDPIFWCEVPAFLRRDFSEIHDPVQTRELLEAFFQMGVSREMILQYAGHIFLRYPKPLLSINIPPEMRYLLMAVVGHQDFLKILAEVYEGT